MMMIIFLKISTPKIDNIVNFVYRFVNIIMDDILTNTFSFVQLKPNLPKLRDKDELFYLGVINRESHQQAIQRLSEKWFQMYLTQENMWKERIKQYKEELVDFQQKLQ
jgi:hypothetical protein